MSRRTADRLDALVGLAFRGGCLGVLVVMIAIVVTAIHFIIKFW